MVTTEKSFDEIYRQNYSRIYSYIRRSLRQEWPEAEDLTQQVFLIAFQKWDELQEHPNIPVFLTQVAKNILLKRSIGQKVAYMGSTELMTVMSLKQAEDPAYDMVEYYASIESILSKGQLYLLRQYYENGYTAEEIARGLGIQGSCFKRRIARMKEKVRIGMELAAWMVLITGASF